MYSSHVGREYFDLHDSLSRTYIYIERENNYYKKIKLIKVVGCVEVKREISFFFFPFPFDILQPTTFYVKKLHFLLFIDFSFWVKWSLNMALG